MAIYVEIDLDDLPEMTNGFNVDEARGKNDGAEGGLGIPDRPYVTRSNLFLSPPLPLYKRWCLTGPVLLFASIFIALPLS